MCARARLSSDYSELKIRFQIPETWPAPNIPARWNAAPTQTLPIVRYDAELGHRRLDAMRWGLIPFWARDQKIGYSTINAMAETVDTKPAFREAFRKRPCIVPVDNFYEWHEIAPKLKQPYAIALRDRSVMALAGLWETWRDPASGETVRSFSVITCPPNALCAPIHNRMPVILPEAAWPAWMGEEQAETGTLKSLLVPYPADDMEAWPVDRRVGNVRNDDPGLVARIAS